LQRCDIFDIPTLVTFLNLGLEYWNSIPYLTTATWNSTQMLFGNGFISQIIGISSAWALASTALSERGREFQISDGGVSLTPPSISELLNTQYQNELNIWKEIITQTKRSLSPEILGSGTLSGNISRSPALARLRFLKE